MTLKPLTQILFALLPCLKLLPIPAIGNPISIQLIDRVPVEIETACYQLRPDSNEHIIILSPDCRLWIPGAGSHIASTVFHFNKPIPPTSRKSIEYRILFETDNGPWKPVVTNDTTNNNRIFLANVQLSPDRRCELQFRDASGIIQSQVIQRTSLVPQYKNFRQHAPAGHTNEETLFSKSLQQSASKYLDGESGSGTVLYVQPGQATDILLTDLGLNVDSSMEYSFEPFGQSNANAWKVTGMVLHLDALPGNANYLLQVRYRGMTGALNLFMVSKPYWYQHFAFKIFLTILMATGLLVVPGYIYHYRSKREKWLRSKVERELQLVHNQLNPHFIYNSLGSINGLISSGETTRATQYLSVFSGMMRHTMSVSDKTVITLAEDLDQMEQYLRIEQLRFEFRYCIDISPTLDLKDIKLPPQLLQPSLENAVKHGASGLLDMGEVRLRVYAESDDLHIRIVNNNKKGFRRPDKGQGQGLQFTYEQIGYLRQLYREREIRFGLQVTDEGAEASFFFENWLKPV